MWHEILVSPEAAEDLRLLGAPIGTKAKDLIERHLRHEPDKASKSRIKRLRGLKHPQYRLRIDDIRVFYDVEGGEVRILAVISKSKVAEWLEKAGKKS